MSWTPLLWWLPVVCIAVLVIPGRAVLKVYCLLILWLLMVRGGALPSDEQLKIMALDVGKPVLTVVSYQHKAIIYADAAALKPFRLKSLIIPYLNQQRIRQVDTILVGAGVVHLSKELNTFIHRYKVQTIYIPSKLMDEALSLPSRVLVKNCLTDADWDWGMLTLKLISQLNSPEHYYRRKVSKSNRACVLQISSKQAQGRTLALFTGDLDKAGLKRLLKNKLLTGLGKGNPNQLDIWLSGLSARKMHEAKKLMKVVNPEHVIFSATLSDNKARTGFSFPSNYLNTQHTGAISALMNWETGLFEYETQRNLDPSVY